MTDTVCISLGIATAVACLAIACAAAATNPPPQASANGPQYKVAFSFAPAEGLGHEKGLCRRDPSDIIGAGDEHFVWYTKVERWGVKTGRHGYNSGYQGEVWCAVSSDAGRTWKELGRAIAKGPAGAFDCTGVFTPNILAWDGKYYLYYTAVGPDFDNGPYEDRNRTAIGVAVSDSPRGPWVKSKSNPVLKSTRDPNRFDSYRVDDSCFVVRGGKIWMYYKGRQWKNTPANTKMGVAVAERPEGPFTRVNEGRTVQPGGHEVMVWPWGDGVMSLVSKHGRVGQTLQYAADGVRFKSAGTIPSPYPRAPGLFRPDLTDPDAKLTDRLWGISMTAKDGDPYLQRYEIALSEQ